jgi:hypothetical protein
MALRFLERELRRELARIGRDDLMEAAVRGWRAPRTEVRGLSPWSRGLQSAGVR